jgi:hypothetical protein
MEQVGALICGQLPEVKHLANLMVLHRFKRK